MSEKKQHKAWVNLTVAEGKRLIALGLKHYPKVKRCLEKGRLVIAKGTTNTYVLESLTDLTLANGDYVNGHILPQGGSKKLDKVNIRPEVVLENGSLSDKTYPDVMETMGNEDIILKGANIINYEKKQAGVIVVHPTGGTCGLITPPIEKNKIQLIIPVGLEKDSSEDIRDLAEKSLDIKENCKGNTPYVWALEGEIFTEIEALKQLVKLDITPIGKGGIGGAEGGVSLLLSGEETELNKALKIIKDLQGESDYVK